MPVAATPCLPDTSWPRESGATACRGHTPEAKVVVLNISTRPHVHAEPSSHKCTRTSGPSTLVRNASSALRLAI